MTDFLDPKILHQPDFKEEEDYTDNAENVDDKKRYFGQVKWFNTKAGYGFITVCLDGTELQNKDIFVHYTALMDKTRPQRATAAAGHQYKYLVQGEYVEFSVTKPNNSDKYEYHAVGVSGILGGNILCETRRIGLENEHFRSSGGTGSVRQFDNEKSSRPTRYSVPDNSQNRPKYSTKNVESDDGFQKVVTKREKKTG